MKQRVEYNKQQRGEKSQLQQDRIERLNEIGFSWVSPNYNKSGKQKPKNQKEDNVNGNNNTSNISSSNYDSVDPNGNTNDDNNNTANSTANSSEPDATLLAGVSTLPQQQQYRPLFQQLRFSASHHGFME